MTLRVTLEGRDRSRKYRRKHKRGLWRSLWLAPFVALFCWVGYREVRSQFVRPQAIFVLGGDTKREDFAADFARHYPDLPIWVSGGSNQEYAEEIFSHAGNDLHRLHTDRRAEDTLTNFTTLADQLKAQGVTSVYLITSDYHMRRARVIGEIVFGSRGILLKPIVVPSQEQPESLSRAVRDGARAVLWVTTGVEITKPSLEPKRRVE
jgi:uncharacterized SAM-binding protein YcdF (DUF218 family)